MHDHAAMPLTLTADDNGKELTLQKNGRLLVKLEANPTTGYTWELMGDPTPLELVTTDYLPAQTPERVGTPRSQQLKFKAIGTGSAKLELGYRRPWEKGVAPAKTFSATVKVE